MGIKLRYFVVSHIFLLGIISIILNMYVLESKISTLPNCVYICNDKVKKSNYELTFLIKIILLNDLEFMLSKFNL